MDDAEFLTRMGQRIQESTGLAVEVELEEGRQGSVEVELDRPVPRVVMGSDALSNPGRARMYMQYAILCLREGRKATEREFLLFLRRN